MEEDIRVYGSGGDFVRRLRGRKFLFALVMSYTRTAEIPGITVAGANPDILKFTPPADAEFISYGACRCIDAIPMTPDGKPTPALLTRVALRCAGTPFVAVDAGGMIRPHLPFIYTGLGPGGDISREQAMSEDVVAEAIAYGKITGGTLAALSDCLVIGESIPGGTTTAQAVMQALGIDARSSSSMPENPTAIKARAVESALARVRSRDIIHILAHLADPMIPFVAGMLLSASQISPVLLAGGTQMAAVLAAARSLGFDGKNAAVGTTRYVVDDATANLLDIVDIPVLAVDPKMAEARADGLRAFAEGFAKEGAGAGGGLISAILGAGADAACLRDLADAEYARISAPH